MYKLDGICTIVDAKHVTQHLDEEKPEGVENEAVEQLAFADRILLNKVQYLIDCEGILECVCCKQTNLPSPPHLSLSSSPIHTFAVCAFLFCSLPLCLYALPLIFLRHTLLSPFPCSRLPPNA